MQAQESPEPDTAAQIPGQSVSQMKGLLCQLQMLVLWLQQALRTKQCNQCADPQSAYQQNTKVTYFTYNNFPNID
jgi:hypothetical protein